jgi:hypothetical protein
MRITTDQPFAAAPPFENQLARVREEAILLRRIVGRERQWAARERE